jgi:hypothetical protein
MLHITTNDNKTPPYVVINRKIMSKENFCNDVLVWGQKQAWMSLELMEDRFGFVWECHPCVLSKSWSMLVMDAFCSHLSDRVRNR